MMGLCFGGGQLGLGLAALCLALVVLWCLKWVELRYIDREHRGELLFAFEAGAAIEHRITPRFVAAGFAMHPRSAAFDDQVRPARCTTRFGGTPRNRCKRHSIWCMS